ncbi:hypothetical protein HII31_01838 [Pseudocercospora fuligena]|uniref:Uncharacterized protein n=1 Tax=Pseudocercospora fuligena TaxID=685502 RepID=A0A8H6RS42_9PEZI|nr:hypothetical protein HII31_01838 [Pseudocercospora fuligena]
MVSDVGTTSTSTSLEKSRDSTCSSAAGDEIEGLLGGGTLKKDGEICRLRQRLLISYVVNAVLVALSTTLSVALYFGECKDPSASHLQMGLSGGSSTNFSQHWVTRQITWDFRMTRWTRDGKLFSNMPKHDQLTENLDNTSIITKSEAQGLQIPTMAIPGTDHYLVELSVFHDLHCVNELRKMLYPERYGLLENFKLPDGSVNRTSFGYKHWDALRQTLVCNADVSPLSFHVNVPFNRGIYPRLATAHSCRDFSLVQEWAKTHHAQGFQGRIYNFTRLQEIIDDTDIDHSTEEDLQDHPDLFPGDEYFHYWREHPYAGDALRPQLYPTKDHKWQTTLWG